MHPGRDRPELRDPARLRWLGHHRAQPDVLKEPGSASASDLGGERQGPAPGGACAAVSSTHRPSAKMTAKGTEGMAPGHRATGTTPSPGAARRPGEDANHRDKKTQRWLDGLHDVAGAASKLSRKTRVVSVMDREADFFELFDEQRRLHRTEVLVRAKHDRCLGKGRLEAVRNDAQRRACGHVEIEIDRVSERRKSSRKKAAQRAASALRWPRSTIASWLCRPPSREPNRPRSRWSMCAKPHRPTVRRQSSGSLLTSLDVDRFEAAVSIIGYLPQTLARRGFPFGF